MWFRFYTDALDDPKVQRLPAERFKQWVNLLCLAKEDDGLLPSTEDIAFRLRIPDTEARSLVEELAKRGLLDADGENFSPHNWHNRQFQSDSSTERVKRFRNAAETLDETAPETEADTETEPEQSRDRGGAGGAPPASRGKPRSARSPVLPDEEWLDAMQKNPAYSMLNVRMLYHRMLAWCEERGKVPSRRRLINWMNNEDKPMTAKSSPPKGNGQVGASPKPLPTVAALLTDAQMADFVDELIEAGDFEGIGEQYDLIVQRGGAKAEWEIRAVAYYELHKDQPATPEQVAGLKAGISALVPKGAR